MHGAQLEVHEGPGILAPALGAGVETPAQFRCPAGRSRVHSCLNVLLGPGPRVPPSGTGAEHCVHIWLMRYLIQHWVCSPPYGPENPSRSVSTPCLIAPLPRPYRPGTLHCTVWPLVLVNTPASSSTLRGAPKYKAHCQAPTISTCSLKEREFQYFVIHSWPRASPPPPILANYGACRREELPTAADGRRGGGREKAQDS